MSSDHYNNPLLSEAYEVYPPVDPDRDDATAAPSALTDVTDRVDEDPWVPRSSPPLGQCQHCAQDPPTFYSPEEVTQHYSQNHPEKQWNDQPRTGSPPRYVYDGRVGVRYGAEVGNEPLVGGGGWGEIHEADSEDGDGSPIEGHEPDAGGSGTVRNRASMAMYVMCCGEGAAGGTPMGEYPKNVELEDHQELAHNGCNGNTGNHNGHSHGDARGPGAGSLPTPF